MIEVEINLFDKLKAAKFDTSVFFEQFDIIQDWVKKNCKGEVSLGEPLNPGEWSEIYVLHFENSSDAIMFKLWWA